MGKVEIHLNVLSLALDKIQAVCGADEPHLIQSIMEWNKAKVYPYSPISIEVTKEGVVDNSEKVGEFVSMIEEYSNDVDKNALSKEEVTEAKKIIFELHKFLSETRKIQTAPLNKVVGNYTKHEKVLLGLSQKMSDKLDKMKEKEYQITENVIKEYFIFTFEENGVYDILNLEMFKDFIENKRKTKIFTKTGLTKAFKDSVNEVVRLAYAPIKEAKELQALQVFQSKTFERHLEKIEVIGDSEKLEANINSLIRMKEDVSELYPDVEDSCNRSIDNKIASCRANIRANTAIYEKEAIENVDIKIMERVEEIDDAIGTDCVDIEIMRENIIELQSILAKVKFGSNQTIISNFISSLVQRIDTLQVQEIFETEDKKADEPNELNTYTLDEDELSSFMSLSIQAMNQKEAKEIVLQRLKQHLQFYDLIEGK